LKDDFNIFFYFYFWVYSQIWLNLPRDDDRNFFCIFLWMIAPFGHKQKSPPQKIKTMGGYSFIGAMYYPYKNGKRKRKSDNHP
jgi:hypothetical protein